MSTIQKEMHELRKIFWEGRYYFLSHHPLCERFKDDCYEIRGHRLCIGCFTAYPIALFSIVLYYLINIEISYQYLILIGTCTGGVQFLSLHPKSNRKWIKIFIKVFLGIGFGAFTIGIFSLPFPLIHRLIIFILCVQITSYFAFLRIKKIREVCKNCEFEKDWGNCPGFPK